MTASDECRKLLPCPFCGNEPHGVFGPHPELGSCWVECHHGVNSNLNCGDWHWAPESNDMHEAREETRLAWNRRAPASAQAEGEAKNLFACDDIVRHRKGGTYKVVGRAFIEATMTDSYVYRGEDGCMWVRPALEMEDGRFTLVSPQQGKPEMAEGEVVAWRWLCAGAAWRDGQPRLVDIKYSNKYGTEIQYAYSKPSPQQRNSWQGEAARETTTAPVSSSPT